MIEAGSANNFWNISINTCAFDRTLKFRFVDQTREDKPPTTFQDSLTSGSSRLVEELHQLPFVLRDSRGMHLAKVGAMKSNHELFRGERAEQILTPHTAFACTLFVLFH